MNKALYKIVGNRVNITPKVKCELDGLYRVGPQLNRSSSLTVTPGGQVWCWTVVCVRSGSGTLGCWVDRSTFKAGVFEIASPAELSDMKPPTHSLGKRLVGPTGSKIIVRVWLRGGKGAM